MKSESKNKGLVLRTPIRWQMRILTAQTRTALPLTWKPRKKSTNIATRTEILQPMKLRSRTGRFATKIETLLEQDLQQK